ncbi:MAG: MFS transporter, partial [Desulfuromonadales bacterium]|nr:MFS transporter [Desulfuromonadales bacterium]
ILVTTWGWRSIFYLSVPLGLLTLLVTSTKLRGEWADARGEPFDWQGGLVYAGAILLLIVGASNLNHGLWAFALMLAGILGIVLFLYIESCTTYPLLNMVLLRDNRVFALSNLAALLNYAATFGVTFFFSLYLQYVKGMNAREAGLILIVQPLLQTLLSPLCGRLADRYPAARVATIGMALCALGLGFAASIDAATPLPSIMATLALLGTGFALFSSPNTSVIMGSVEPHYLGVASSLGASMRTLGMMTSMMIITVIFSIFMADAAVTAATLPQFLRSMQLALWIFCALCGIGILFSAARWQPSLREEN